MDSNKNDELLIASDEPDVGILQDLYEETINDLEEYFQQQQRNYNTRRNIWPGKSDDFKKKAVNSETGRVFPFENAADHEVYDIDDHIRSNKVMMMNALRRASVNATPVGHEDTERAALTSQYMRWMVNTKMTEFYDEADLGLDNFLEKGNMVSYVFWDSMDQKVKKDITVQDLARITGATPDIIMTGAADEALQTYFQETYEIDATEAAAALNTLRTEGKTELVATEQIRNQPCVRTLMPDEDVFFPPNTINPEQAPYAFLDVRMNAEEVVSRGAKEGWKQDFIDKAVEIAQNPQNQQENWHIRTREKYLDDLDDEHTVRITYCYRKLVDEKDIPGIYCTIIAHDVDEEYGDHYLLDYAHGLMPFVATPLERTTKRYYASRSFAEIGASAQQIVKAEQDASIDNLSLKTLPPLMHPPGKPPPIWGPGAQVSVFRPDQYKYADTPDSNPDSFRMREEVRKMASKYFGRADNEADPVEIQNKQQDLVNRMLSHYTKVFRQIYSLCQQFGDEYEYFQVVGVNQMQKYTKGDPSEKYDFWIEFDVSTQDPGNMVKRVEAVGNIAQQLGMQGRYDADKLFQISVGTIMPGAANQFLLSAKVGTEKAVEEERQAISQLMAGVPPNVRENDAHQIKYQVLTEWKQQPDIQQMIASNEALAARVENYEKQRMFQIQQDQNAEIGRRGAQSTGFGQTTDL